MVVHGDLKGSNVLLRTPTEEHSVAEEDSRGFVAVVSDFGLSRLEGAEGAGASGEYSPRRRSVEMGAISHAAPEVVAGSPLSKAADVFALGVLLWELVSSRMPFAGLNAAQVGCSWPSPARSADTVCCLQSDARQPHLQSWHHVAAP